MGFFDRFKKNKETKVYDKNNKPLSLQYNDGTVANITFNGIVEIDGKNVHQANIEYINSDGTFRGKQVLLEPINIMDNEGKWQDATEQYYRQLSTRDGSSHAQSNYNAVKAFFKKQNVEDNVIGSNYIGNLAKNENGQFIRNYDNEFKQKCVQKHMKEKEAKRLAQQQRETDFLINLQEKVENTPVNIKTSHAEHLTREKSPFEER